VSDTVDETAPAAGDAAVIQRLSTLDRLLPVWIGIDVSKELPKKLRTEDVAASDVVITMGCGDACPVFPGKRYEDWELTDPAGKSPDEVAGSARRSTAACRTSSPSSPPRSDLVAFGRCHVPGNVSCRRWKSKCWVP
jgi:hypothetical protein